MVVHRVPLGGMFMWVGRWITGLGSETVTETQQVEAEIKRSCELQMAPPVRNPSPPLSV